MNTIVVEGLTMTAVLLAIGNLRALLGKASADDRLIALKFLYWSKAGPVFECDDRCRARFEWLRRNPPVHSVFGDYQI